MVYVCEGVNGFGMDSNTNLILVVARAFESAHGALDSIKQVLVRHR